MGSWKRGLARRGRLRKKVVPTNVNSTSSATAMPKARRSSRNRRLRMDRTLVYWVMSALELVADPVDGDNVFAGFQLAPQVADVGVDGPFIAFKGHPADGVQQLRAGEDAPRLAHHGGQQLEFSRGQRDAAVGQEGLVVGPVER